MFFDLNWTHPLAGVGGSAATLGAIALVKALSRGKFRMSFGNGNGNGNGNSDYKCGFSTDDLERRVANPIVEAVDRMSQKFDDLRIELAEDRGERRARREGA